MDVTYVDHMGTDVTVVQAARASFGKTCEVLTERDVKLINYLAKHRHDSVFEHCTMTVEIKCPLFIRSQIMRHRSMSYNEFSRRYTSDDIEFYTPPVWKQQAKDNRQSSSEPIEDDGSSDWYYSNVVNYALKGYNHLLANGVSREQARMVLPQSTYTRFIMTGNLRNWHHFISLRTHPGAQEEAQIIARKIQQLLTMHFPVSMAALSTAKGE